MCQPPFSGGWRLTERWTVVPQSVATTSTVHAELAQHVGADLGDGVDAGDVGGLEVDDLLAVVAGGRRWRA